MLLWKNISQSRYHLSWSWRINTEEVITGHAPFEFMKTWGNRESQWGDGDKKVNQSWKICLWGRPLYCMKGSPKIFKKYKWKEEINGGRDEKGWTSGYNHSTFPASQGLSVIYFPIDICVNSVKIYKNKLLIHTKLFNKQLWKSHLQI